MSDSTSTDADIYSALMDVRSWLADHLDADGKINADQVDDLIAAITDEIDGSNAAMSDKPESQTTVPCPVTGNPECKETWCRINDRCYLDHEVVHRMTEWQPIETAEFYGPWIHVDGDRRVVYTAPPPDDPWDRPFICPCTPAWRCVYPLCRPPSWFPDW